jgi:hypothetical protein
MSSDRELDGSQTVGEDAAYISLPTQPPDEDEEKDAPVRFQIKGWPETPMTLTEGRSWVAISIAKDALFVFVAALFIGKRISSCTRQLPTDSTTALAIIAIRLHGKPVSQYGGHVQAATKLGPTIFPIVFAATASAAIRGISRMLIARGATVGARYRSALPHYSILR